MSDEGKLQQLLGGEFVRVELFGSIDTPTGWAVVLDVLAILIGGVSVSSGGRAAHVGATARELVIAETKLFGRPPDMRRFPLDKVQIVKSSEGMLTDEIVLEVGEPKKIRVQLPAKKRELTRQLMGMLGSVPA